MNIVLLVESKHTSGILNEKKIHLFLYCCSKQNVDSGKME